MPEGDRSLAGRGEPWGPDPQDPHTLCKPTIFCRIPILYKQFTWKPNITFFSLSLPSSIHRVLLHKLEESIVRRGWYVVGNCPSGLSPGGSVSLQLL